MKKLLLLSLTVALAISLSMCLMISASAEDVMRGGTWGALTWELNETTGELIISGKGDMEPLDASSAWLAYRNIIQTVIIQDGVTSIGHCAFIDCYNLSSISIPDSIGSIGYLSFRNCDKLTEITIPDSCTFVSDEAFWECDYIAKATIPCNAIVALPQSGLRYLTITNGTEIPNGAFQDKSALVSISLPDSVTSIGNYAFYNCLKLESIILPDGLISIGNHAFHNCQKLESINIPDSVTFIGKWCFSGCEKLSSISLPESLTSIGDYMFNFCKSLKSVSIPENVTSIGNNAFFTCDSLSEIIIPDKVTSISNFAFADCSGLKKIVIPDGIETLSGYAFDTTFNIEEAVMPIATISYIPRGKLKTVVFTSGTSIPEEAFSGCAALERVFFCGTDSEWDSVKKNDKWMSGHRNVEFSFHDCSWESTDETHLGFCSRCDAVIESPHLWDNGIITKQPTHLETGIKVYSCIVCEKSKDTALEKSEEHHYVNWIDLDETQHKKICECEQVFYEDHVYGSWTVITPSTEESKGQRQRICACGRTVTESIPVLKHIYIPNIIKPTCEEKGYTLHTCRNCGEGYKDSYVDAAGHIYDNILDSSCNECEKTRISIIALYVGIVLGIILLLVGATLSVVFVIRKSNNKSPLSKREPSQDE